MKRVEIKTYSLTTGTVADVNDNLISGLFPNRIVLGLVDSSAYSGNIYRNPFEFKTFGLSRI